MDNYEEILKKRIESLEKKHRRTVFSKNSKFSLSNEIKKDFVSETIETETEPEPEPEPEESIDSTKTFYISSLEPPKSKKDRIALPNNRASFDDKSNVPDGEDKTLLDSIKKSSILIGKIKSEIKKVIIGQEKVLDTLILGLICNGHVLLDGVPGVAKTLTIRALGQVTGCSVKRVQFTVDLLPSDIIGLTTYTPGKGFEIVKGPIFANFLIADEINRASPKTQSALLEAMQERQVTIGKSGFESPNPFFVMATKNPLESTGVYQLPEAQVDRFLFSVIMGYPEQEDEKRIMEENATLKKFDDFKLLPVINPNDILYMKDLAKKIHSGNHVKTYILSIVEKTRDKSFKFADCIAYGSSPRASIALFIASKAKALMEGRSYVIPEDVRAICLDVLRHRVLLSYKATIKGLTSEDIIKEILEEVMV